MNSYCIYRIAETICIMVFMVACILVYDFYPVTALMIILLALLNDLPIMTIAYDHTVVNNNPVHWKMKQVLILATALGTVGVASTFFLIIMIQTYFHLSLPEIQSLIFLQLSISGHQILFVARTREAFYAKPYPSPILFSAIILTQIFAALIVGFGIFVTPIPWSYIGYLWLYTFIWMLVADGVKRVLYQYE
jgi:H+-transporting ATPase